MNSLMTDTAALQRFLADISPVQFSTHPAQVAAQSKDYFWYSPILTELLDGKTGDVVVTPRSQAEVIAVAAACAKHCIKGTGDVK